ncbi:hypothetical protein Tco_0120108, partial [Tanacetum coccineum]
KGSGGGRGAKEKNKVSTRTSLDSETGNVVMESNFPSPIELDAKVPNVISVTDTVAHNPDASTPAQDTLVHDDLVVGTILAHADMSVPNVNESATPTSFVTLVTKKASILEVHSRFGFCLYGYFMGKRVAFAVVEYYVMNGWKKFGLVGVMMNARLFFFKFATIEGMHGVLENGLWFV